MRKKIALAVTAVMLVAGLTGCSEEGGGSSAEKKDEITLTFGSHQSGIPSCGVLQDLAEQFPDFAGCTMEGFAEGEIGFRRGAGYLLCGCRPFKSLLQNQAG